MIPIRFTTSGSQPKNNSSRNGSVMLRLNGHRAQLIIEALIG